MEETLEHNVKDLTKQLRHLDSQPTLDDFEFIRMENQRLLESCKIDKEEIEFLRKENNALRTEKTVPEEYRCEIESLSSKVGSLTRFASNHLQKDVHGAAEFEHTVEKTSRRVQTLAERLRARKSMR